MSSTSHLQKNASHFQNWIDAEWIDLHLILSLNHFYKAWKLFSRTNFHFPQSNKETPLGPKSFTRAFKAIIQAGLWFMVNLPHYGAILPNAKVKFQHLFGTHIHVICLLRSASFHWSSRLGTVGKLLRHSLPLIFSQRSYICQNIPLGHVLTQAAKK